MKQENKSLYIGAAAVAGALLLRLLSGSLPGRLIAFFSKPETVTALTFLETGTMVRLPKPEDQHTPVIPEETHADTPQKIPEFSAKDADLISVNNSSGHSIHIPSLLETPLSWDLRTEAPTVLILHTHTTESYTGSWDAHDPYRSLNDAKNMLAIGDLLANKLESAGIRVIHDRTLHDYPSYNGSYNHARKSIQSYLAEYPSIVLVLDIHRDAREDSQGNQIQTTTHINGQASAQLMAVVGTNGTGLTHPNWQSTLALALKLHVVLERLYPGITRPISLRAQRFNQDLATNAMLIEVGTAGNTLPQALTAADCLANAILTLSPYRMQNEMLFRCVVGNGFIRSLYKAGGRSMTARSGASFI